MQMHCCLTKQIYFYYILNLVTIPNQTLTEEQTAKVIK